MAGLSVKRPLPGLPETDVFVVDLGFLNETQAVSTSFQVFEQIDPISIQIWSEKSCTSAQHRSDHSRKHCSRLFPCYFPAISILFLTWQMVTKYRKPPVAGDTAWHFTLGARTPHVQGHGRRRDGRWHCFGHGSVLTWRLPIFLRRCRCVGNPWKSNCWRKGHGQPKHGTSTYFGRPCHAPTLRKLTKSNKEPCKKSRKWVHNLCRMYRNHWKPFVCVCGSLTAQKVGNAVCRWSGDRSETVSQPMLCQNTWQWGLAPICQVRGSNRESHAVSSGFESSASMENKAGWAKSVHSFLVFLVFLGAVPSFHKSSYRSLPVPVQQQQDTPRISVEGGAKRQVEPGGAAVYAQRKQSISWHMSYSGLKGKLSETVHAFVWDEEDRTSWNELKQIDIK